MKMNISLSVDTMERNILLDSLEVYKGYLQKELNKTTDIEVSKKLFDIKQKTDEMYESIKQI